MREKARRVIVTFHTTAEAMATERLCLAEGLKGRLIPAPRALSADCGIAWSAPAESRSALERALTNAGIETAGITEMAV